MSVQFFRRRWSVGWHKDCPHGPRRSLQEMVDLMLKDLKQTHSFSVDAGAFDSWCITSMNSAESHYWSMKPEFCQWSSTKCSNSKGATTSYLPIQEFNCFKWLSRVHCKCRFLLGKKAERHSNCPLHSANTPQIESSPSLCMCFLVWLLAWHESPSIPQAKCWNTCQLEVLSCNCCHASAVFAPFRHSHAHS